MQTNSEGPPEARRITETDLPQYPCELLQSREPSGWLKSKDHLSFHDLLWCGFYYWRPLPTAPTQPPADKVAGHWCKSCGKGPLYSWERNGEFCKDCNPSEPPAPLAGGTDIQCPFCHENDFDAIGLKLHLSDGDCEAYNNLSVGRARIKPL